jgi:hypothetical protein
MHPLTKTEPSDLDLDLLAYIASYIESHLQHFSPSSGEAAVYFNCSEANIRLKLKTLLKFGYLNKSAKQYHRWYLTPKGKAWWLEYARNA